MHLLWSYSCMTWLNRHGLVSKPAWGSERRGRLGVNTQSTQALQKHFLSFLLICGVGLWPIFIFCWSAKSISWWAGGRRGVKMRANVALSMVMKSAWLCTPCLPAVCSLILLFHNFFGRAVSSLAHFLEEVDSYLVDKITVKTGRFSKSKMLRCRRHFSSLVTKKSFFLTEKFRTESRFISIHADHGWIILSNNEEAQKTRPKYASVYKCVQRALRLTKSCLIIQGDLCLEKAYKAIFQQTVKQQQQQFKFLEGAQLLIRELGKIQEYIEVQLLVLLSDQWHKSN